MRKSIQAVWTVAGFGAAIFGLWLLWQGPNEPGVKAVPGAANDELPPPPDLSFTGESTPANEDVSPLSGMSEPPGALPGHRVWRASGAEALAALRAAAEAGGLRVHGVVPELGLLHVSGASDLLDLLRPEDVEDFVFPVALPPYPDEARFEQQGLTAFRDQAIGFLGLDNVPGTWGAGVRIALLDTGISDHAAFAGADIVRSQWAENTHGTDANGHGTAMTGLLIGRDAYARGIAPAATLLSIPVLNAEGHGDTFDLAQGIIEAANQGAAIINISAGSLGDSKTLEDAVAYARSQGAVVVAAAGNDGSSTGRYPAAYETVIGVTSIDAAGQRPPFANSGPSVNLAAPGLGVYSSWLEDDFISVSGSSAAAPFVAGTIAMLMSENPGLSAGEAADIVLEYVNEAGPVGPDSSFGAGVLNLERLLRRDTPGVVDLALVPPFADVGAATATEVPLYLSVQNRGTTALTQVRLDLEVDGVSYTHTVGRLEPGGSGGTQLPVALERILRTEGVPLEMKTRHATSSLEAETDQTSLSTVIRIAPPPTENDPDE